MEHARDGKANQARAEGAHAPTNVEVMDSICHDVNSALAILVLCIDFLASGAECNDNPAVADARKGIKVVAGEMTKLRDLARAARANANRSGVFHV
jgi:hypothetical protein